MRAGTLLMPRDIRGITAQPKAVDRLLISQVCMADVLHITFKSWSNQNKPNFLSLGSKISGVASVLNCSVTTFIPVKDKVPYGKGKK